LAVGEPPQTCLTSGMARHRRLRSVPDRDFHEMLGEAFSSWMLADSYAAATVWAQRCAQLLDEEARRLRKRGSTRFCTCMVCVPFHDTFGLPETF
jgi:hypothetical protein